MHIPNHSRKAWLALALSFVLPGFGQLYNGEVNKGIWLFLAFALFSIPGISFIALYLTGIWMMPALITSLIATLSIWLYGMIDAWRNARRKSDYQPPGWQLSGIYTLIFLCCTLAQLFLIDYVRKHQVQSFYIPSTSMEPNILKGDVLFADMRYNCSGCEGSVKRGDIAIFVYPNNRTLNYIKRVIALPGDRVHIRGHRLWINGQPLTVHETQDEGGLLVTEAIDGRQWQVRWADIEPQEGELELTVPPGHVLVLGDNRSSSQDSRRFGTVPLPDIVGRARQIWFSKQPEGGVRWERLGRIPE